MSDRDNPTTAELHTFKHVAWMAAEVKVAELAAAAFVPSMGAIDVALAASIFSHNERHPCWSSETAPAILLRFRSLVSPVAEFAEPRMDVAPRLSTTTLKTTSERAENKRLRR